MTVGTWTAAAAAVHNALATVLDPELDQPITELGFVRSVALDDAGVHVHLRLPTAFCAPNFAYLMVADAQEALEAVPGIGRVVVELDDHHDSEKINAGVRAGAGYRGTFGGEAQESLDELRLTFRRKAHLAAMERCCRIMLRRGTWSVEELPYLQLFDLPDSAEKDALVHRRAVLGLPINPEARVLVDHLDRPSNEVDGALLLRLATATRISIEGNAHFCRGMLATRYGTA